MTSQSVGSETPAPLQSPAPPVTLETKNKVVTFEFIKLFLGFHLFMLNISIFNLLPHFLELRGASQSFYGAVAGTLGLVNVLCVVLLGYRADYWSRKATVALYLGLSMTGNLLAVLAMGWAMEWFFVVRFFQGIGIALALPILFAWAMEISPSKRKHEVLAWLGIAGLAANSLGPLLGEFLLSLQGELNLAEHYLPVFIAAGVVQVISWLILMTVKNSRSVPEEGDRRGMAKILFRKASFILLLITFSFGGMFGVFVSFGKNFTVSLGLAYASVLYSSYAGGAILSRFFIGPLTRYLTASHLIPFGLLGIAISYLMLGMSHTYLYLGMAGLLYGLSHGILYPTLAVRYIEAQRPSEIGRATIIMQGSFSAGWGLFPYLGGILVELTGFPTLFAALTSLGGICILIHLITERYFHKGLLQAP